MHSLTFHNFAADTWEFENHKDMSIFTTDNLIPNASKSSVSLAREQIWLALQAHDKADSKILSIEK